MMTAVSVVERDTPTDDAGPLWRIFHAQRDAASRERLILHYESLVRQVAARIGGGLPPTVERADLVSYGMFGLIDAIDRYDPDRVNRFEAFAVPRVRGAIIDGLRASDAVPRSLRDKARALHTAYARLEGRLCRTPTDAEVAHEMEIPEAVLHEIFLQVALVNVIALDELLAPTIGGISIAETLADDSALDPSLAAEAAEARHALVAAVAMLPPREQQVVAMHYFHHETLADIGRTLGITEGRVCQLHAKAIVQLRAKLVR